MGDGLLKKRIGGFISGLDKLRGQSNLSLGRPINDVPRRGANPLLHGKYLGRYQCAV